MRRDFAFLCARDNAIMGVRTELASQTTISPRQCCISNSFRSIWLQPNGRSTKQPRGAAGASQDIVRHHGAVTALLFVGLFDFSVGCLAVALIRSALLTLSYLTLYQVNTATQPNDAAFRPVLGGRTTWHRAVHDISNQPNGLYIDIHR